MQHTINYAEPTPPPANGITITLSVEEATWLRRVVGNISGNPEHPGRKLMGDLYDALERLAPDTWEDVYTFIDGRIHFKA